MNTTAHAAVLDSLELLRTLSREAVRPEDGRARLRQLQHQYTGYKFDLLWEEQAFDWSVQYDVLVQEPDGGTVSVSYCPDRAIPWPMRGIHRWRESDLLRVNETTLTLEQAVSCIDRIWDDSRILGQLLDACIMQEALDQEPAELSDSEVQLAMDGFRRAHRLYSAADTYQWLQRKGLTHEQLERLAVDEARLRKLRQRVTDGQVEAYFDGHRDELRTARIACFQCPDEHTAQALVEQIRDGSVEFYQAAESSFVAADARTQESFPLFRTIRRNNAPEELGRAVFAAQPGDVLGPIRIDDRFSIVRVLSTMPADLDAATREALSQLLFQEWLAARRDNARIEWYWGNADRIAHSMKTLVPA